MRRATRPTTSHATAPRPQLVMAFLTPAPSPVNCLTPAVRLKTPRSAQSAARRTAATSALRVLASSTTSTAPSSSAVAASRHANHAISPRRVRRRLMPAPVSVSAFRAVAPTAEERRAFGTSAGPWVDVVVGVPFAAEVVELPIGSLGVAGERVAGGAGSWVLVGALACGGGVLVVWSAALSRVFFFVVFCFFCVLNELVRPQDTPAPARVRG